MPGDHVAADGAEEENIAPSDDGSDVDVDTHDFGDDGQLLPETLTQIAAVSSSNERAAQLAADHLEIDGTLGLAEIKVRYLKHLNFIDAKDSYGDGEVSFGVVLLPTADEAGASLQL